MSTKTNGSTPTLDHERVIREATYEAARFGWYDTSEAAQKANLLTVSVFNMASMEALPVGASHKFYVCINATAYMVTRMQNGAYQVTAYDQNLLQQQERELRSAVLDYAVYYLNNGRAEYMPGQGDKAREKHIKELLEDEANYDLYSEEEQPESDKHPIIRDYEPFITIDEPGFVSGPQQMVERQWYVQVGPAHCCFVGLIGYLESVPGFVGANAEYEQPEEEGPEE